jgi:lipoprotein Spr
MSDLLATLPPRFRAVSYDGAQVPDGSHDLSGGANCQRYAYAVLAHFGIELPPWRSSELWTDVERTEVVTPFQPLDLLLFSRDGQAYGAHVAVYVGEGRALHLAKSVGRPAVWSLAEFTAREEYRVLVGGKRALR